jgi:ATP-dependent helicase STH1/SNF2
LPNKQDYADYYKVIMNPIAMDMIMHRINSPYYTTIEAFQNDFLLMFSNAMKYNVEGSIVYQDAVQLQNIFKDVLSQSISSSVANPPSADSSGVNVMNFQ